MENEVEMYKNEGFKGFLTVNALRSNISVVPTGNGVYIVVRESMTTPTFLTVGTGGHFKGKNPNVDVSELQNNYIDDSKILYIGKATNLRRRIDQLLRFGNGEKVGHWGGRYLWQLADSNDLLIAWMEIPDRDFSQVERSMLEDFRTRHDELPFANLKNG